MTRKTSLKATVGALALIATAALATAACGRDGSLERPGPMFGLPANDQPQDHGRPVPQSSKSSSSSSSSSSYNRTSDGATAGNKTDDDDNTPTTARDIRDPAQRLTPLSASPLPGLSDPLGPPVSTKPPG